MAVSFSYINDASVDLKEVCLHITYLFLKELVFVNDFFLLTLLSHENLHSLPELVSRLFFTGIDSSSDTAVSSTLLIYSFLSFFEICLFILLSFLTFFFKSIAWNLLSRNPYSISISVPVSVIPLPDSVF